MNHVYIYALLVFLIVLSAFFSGSEIALASCNKIRLENAAEAGKRSAARAKKLADNFTRTISTILVGNNLVNIAASSAATVLALEIDRTRGPTYAAIIMTVVILIFGEILPKIFAAEFSDRIVLFIAPILRGFMYLFAPVVSAVTAIVDRMARWWTPKESAPQTTTEELRTLLDTIEEEGVFTEKETDLIRNAIEFTDVTAKEILVPRVDVFGFDIEDDVEELLHDEELLTHSRFPVYEGSMDNVIGILSGKRLIREKLRDPNVDVRTLLTPPLYVHMTRPISSILKEFRRTKTHMAIVVDEFGGMMGILTVEDIVEEIVGDIFDESDEVEEELVETGTGSYEVEGSMNVYDMFEMIGVEDHDFESEYTTVGGWATEMLDRFPQAGDSFTYKNLTVTVTEAAAMRVEKLRVDVAPEEKDGEDE